MAITTNVVQVTGQAVDFGGGPVAGSLTFEVSDLVWATDVGQTIFSAGSGAMGVQFNPGSPAWTVPLFATDNTGISTNWKWKVRGQINGFTFPPRLLTVAFANGAQQSFCALLQTSVLAP